MNILSNLFLAAKVIFTLVYLVWIVHLFLKDASIIDLIWGAGFGIVAVVLYLFSSQTNYHVLLATLPIVWALRYSFFILKRNLGKGEDDRYTYLRHQANEKGQSWMTVSFIRIYTFQALAMLLVSLPLVIGLSANGSVEVGALAILGTVIWLIGFLFEAIADIQLEKFKRENNDYDGPYETKPLLTSGLWKYSRHPNYFGNACIWWGIGIVALEVSFGWVGLVGPLFMNFALVFLTGKANNESKMIKRTAYQNYIESTSGFFPLPKRK